MSLSTPVAIFLTLLALIHIPTSSAAECGQWYSAACVCDADIRYCPDGENGASDNIHDQHPFWKHYEGFYRYSSYLYAMGLNPNTNDRAMFKFFPGVGFMNQTIKGSRTFNHRYEMFAPNPNADCAGATDLDTWDGKCGINGISGITEGFGTGTPERDGSVTTTLALQPSTGGGNSTMDDAEYIQMPIDENTLFGSAKSSQFLVTETFSFTNTERTQASAIQDVYMTYENKTTLVQSTRFVFEKIPDAQTFEDSISATYRQFNIPLTNRYPVPMTAACNDEVCPTEEDFCEIDPRCTALVKYEEPDASVSAGPIAGIVVAAFVFLIFGLYMVHRKMLKDQAQRNQAKFARRIAENINLSGPDHVLSPEDIAAEFRKIDNDSVDGLIDKAELWEFINSGKVVTMSKSDFNALFSSLDADGDGTVSFMEFSAYMGKAYGDFEEVKQRTSVLQRGGAADDNFYDRVSSRILNTSSTGEREGLKDDYYSRVSMRIMSVAEPIKE